MNFLDEVMELKEKYSRKFGHRLEVDICSDVGEWTVSFGMEGWSCELCTATHSSLMVAMDLAVIMLTEEWDG